MPSIDEIAAKRAEQAAKRAKTTGDTVTDKPADKPVKTAPAKTTGDPAAVAEARTVGKLSEVAANPLNPRRIDANSADMLELRADLKERGQQTPVQVVTADHYRRIFEGTAHIDKAGKHAFVIVGGGRRRAALAANRSTSIKFNVLHGKDAPQNPAEWLAATGSENIQREDWTVMETARYLRDLKGYSTGREVAAMLHKSPGWVSQIDALNALPASVQAVIETAPFSVRQARSLLDYRTEKSQLAAAERIAAELLGLPSPAERVKPESTLPADQGDGDETDADGAGESTVKTGRKAYTPAQKLASVLAKNDRETILEALAHRFAVSVDALSALLVEPVAADPAEDDDPAADQDSADTQEYDHELPTV